VVSVLRLFSKCKIMACNLVICCGGTGNRFDSVNTNVARIIQVIARDPARQRLYYDPRVGTAWGAGG
jgi:uncharacterized protein (DUF2235 family)